MFTVTKYPRLLKTQTYVVFVVFVALDISLSLFAGKIRKVHIIEGFLWFWAVCFSPCYFIANLLTTPKRLSYYSLSCVV